MSNDLKNPVLNRRGLLTGLAGLGVAWSSSGPTAALEPKAAPGAAGGRAASAHAVRLRAAEQALSRGLAAAAGNGDEERLPGLIACFSKALPHNTLGEVDPKAYAVLLKALRSGKPEDFEVIPLGGFTKLANPQAAFAFDLVGPDSAQFELAAAPRFDSAEQAAEMVEVYWQALTRDVPFNNYESDPLIAAAAEEMSRLSAPIGAREGGKVTPRLLFRGTAPGDGVGPYISQFLWKPIPYTPLVLEQKIRTAVPGLDYATRTADWLALQNGALAEVNTFEKERLYIRNGRDLGEYVHRDFSYQAFLGALLTALKMGTLPDGGNPYKHSRTQSGFATFGQPYLLYLLAVVTQVALKVCWYQKWVIHRRLRPEEMGGRIEAHLSGSASYPLHDEILGSVALTKVKERFGSAFLPLAYPEGCPTHPAYPAGHAVIAGACVTALKACLDEKHEIPEPVVASADGRSLERFVGPSLTVGGELDKLASNIALGRNTAGVHWRSDASAGLELGERVAIAILAELRLTGNELFQGYSLRRFDGTRVVV